MLQKDSVVPRYVLKVPQKQIEQASNLEHDSLFARARGRVIGLHAKSRASERIMYDYYWLVKRCIVFGTIAGVR